MLIDCYHGSLILTSDCALTHLSVKVRFKSADRFVFQNNLQCHLAIINTGFVRVRTALMRILHLSHIALVLRGQ